MEKSNSTFVRPETSCSAVVLATTRPIRQNTFYKISSHIKNTTSTIPEPISRSGLDPHITRLERDVRRSRSGCGSGERAVGSCGLLTDRSRRAVLQNYTGPAWHWSWVSVLVLKIDSGLKITGVSLTLHQFILNVIKTLKTNKKGFVITFQQNVSKFKVLCQAYK